MSTVSYPHIELATSGEAVLAGTQTKVLEIALDRLAHHWDADEIQRQHPHLELAQIHAALTYYYDHQDELDEQIAEQLREVHEMRERLGPSPLVARLHVWQALLAKIDESPIISDGKPFQRDELYERG